MKEYNDLDLDSNNDINKNFNIDKALNQQNIENNNEQNKDINKTKNKKKNKIPTDNLKKKGELNFKKWLLTLSSIGNMILGALLLIMALSAMRYKLDSIFIADKGLIVLSIINFSCEQ